ncbi:MAG: transposase [Sedimentisphaerales bacterium]
MAKHKHYSKEFKLQVARLVAEQGYSLRDTAERLGIEAGLIRYWIKKEHENRVCKAVLDVIAKRKNIVVEGIDYPDEKNRSEQAVDMLVRYSSSEMVVEHTRIESYPRQIEGWSQVRKLLKPIEEMIAHKLPLPGHYELAVDEGAIRGAKDIERIQRVLIEWIKMKAPLLQVGSPNVASKHFIKEKPDNIPFEVKLYRLRRNDGKLRIVVNAPDDLKEKIRQRISVALKEKCPKLWNARGDSRTSVLVFELDDIFLGNHISVREALTKELSVRNDAPDEVYLVETELKPWVVWVLKDEDTLFQDVVKAGPYYSDTIF